jgi:hypothetical protein
MTFKCLCGRRREGCARMGDQCQEEFVFWRKNLGCSKKKKIFPKFLFVAYDVWEQSEKTKGE